MKAVLFVLALFIASTASAQVHPCDAPEITTQTTTCRVPVVFEFCHTLQDLDGSPTTLIAATIYSSGVQLAKMTTPSGMVPNPLTPNAQGKYAFQFAPFMVSKGTKQLTLSVSDADGESGQTPVLTWICKGPGPKSGTNLRSKP